MEKIIEQIETCQHIGGETKLQALCEIDLLMQDYYPDARYEPSDDIGCAFLWGKTSCGFSFWMNIVEAIYK